MPHKPVCDNPACSNYNQPLKRHNATSLWYCGGHMISGNYYAVLGDLVKLLNQADTSKNYTNLNRLAFRIYRLTELILEEDELFLKESLHESLMTELDDSGDRI